ncbi:SHOCT domain-containing protein [Natronorarus salvus]|uniref:SHOCT domain-containing protein n=1 Tax=Natronorarus salvus TaxID=3117733 RepID=UPI002F26A807
MREHGPRERLRENATGVASTVVTGVWLAALFTGQGWWLAALLFGYVVVVPLVALLYGDEGDRHEWWDDWWGEESWEEWWDDLWGEETDEPEHETEPNRRDALETLRERYARGELTDEQFERKLEYLLETETLESVEDRYRERERIAEYDR